MRRCCAWGFFFFDLGKTEGGSFIDNRWQQNGPHTMTESFSGNNNRMDGYSYDAAGNLLSDGTTTYTYDAENRVISASNSNGTTTYVYDGDGRRVRKTVNGVITDFLYDPNGNEVAAVNGSGSWIRGEVYAAGRHIATYTGGTSGNTYFNLTDNLGTERVRATIGGSSAETCTSLPFGDWLQCSGTDSSPMHFTGYERDSESGLDNASARYFGSPLGRFMTPDPLGNFVADPANPQSWNMYSYVLNNPLSLVDPTGTDPGDDSGYNSVYCDPGSGTCLGEDYQPAPVQLTACGWNAVLAGQCTANPANVLSASCGWDEEATGQCSSLSTQCPLGVNGACLGIPLSSGNSTPQTPTPQKPQKKPCTPLANNLQGTPAAGVDTLFDAFNRVTHPLELLELNGIMFVTGGVTAATGGAAVAITCGVPEPFEPLTCAAGVAGGVPTAAGGVFLMKQGVNFFKNVTLPAIKDWGCHE